MCANWLVCVLYVLDVISRLHADKAITYEENSQYLSVVTCSAVPGSLGHPF